MGISAEECVNKCCALGPSGCQYLWVFGSACFGVSCDDDHSACEPRKVSPSFTMETVYIQMNYASIADILAKQILLGDLDEEGSRSGGSRSGGSREGGDSPPVADAGSDFTVQLPVNEIHLYGNGSRDDKVISVACLFVFVCETDCVLLFDVLLVSIINYYMYINTHICPHTLTHTEHKELPLGVIKRSLSPAHLERRQHFRSSYSRPHSRHLHIHLDCGRLR